MFVQSSRFASFAALTFGLAALGGCATAPARNGLAAPAIPARGETVPVGTANADAADDPAIWRNRADPAASLIVATDKKAGLYVYGLDGKVKSFFDAGRVNNVDIADTPSGVVVVASDRNDKTQSAVALFRLDTRTGVLTPLGKISSGAGEGYGICVAPRSVSDAGFTAFAVLKEGRINELSVALGGAQPTGRVVRTMRVATQPEGCVVDPVSRTVYVGEEDRGIWQFSAPGPSTEGRLVASVDNRTLFADVEGLALVDDGKGGRYLIASSQGDNAYAVYALPDHRFVGRFRIDGGPIGGTSETDGIAAMAGDFGPDFPGGLFIAQDGDNAPNAQNFKLIAWDDIARALGLPR